VVEGGFHGHPAGLVWTAGFDRVPQDVPVEELDRRRRRPAVRLPQSDVAGSLGAIVIDETAGGFGPYGGQCFVADWTYARIHRVFLERVGGELQGACFPFLDGGALRRGTHRLAFAPDASLHLGQVSRLWGGTGEGIQRVVWTGEVPFDVLEMRLRPRGFTLRFTRPVDAASASDRRAYSIESHDYLYQAAYGSPKVRVEAARVERVHVLEDGLSVELDVEPLVEGKVYELRPRGLADREGHALATAMAAYTLNRLAR
jgi:hypothetical protein